VVCAHASPAGHCPPGLDSFSHATADVAERVLTSRAWRVARRDLNAERFDPVQPTGEAQNTTSRDDLVERHCAELAAADLIGVFHPNCWGQPPAILKGWIERVFRLDTAYSYAQGVGFESVPVGLLKARRALVFNTSDTTAACEAEVFGDPLDTLWRRYVFGLCGVSDVSRRCYGPVAGSAAEQRHAWLLEVEAIVNAAALTPR
jgi:NAD(P)H dehydrogenase (quinone)